jgi:tetratricopeptide (TPR) repeat protein
MRPSVDWVGALSSVPLAEVCRRIVMEDKSGDLQVNLGSAIKTIYFDNGFVVFAASNLKRDRLGESLIEAGRISRHEFALASMLMKGSKRKFGQALVQAGVMSEEELGREVAGQVNRIVLSLFKAKDGIYSFDERGAAVPVELMVSLSIYRILLEGIRYMTDGKLILAGLPPLDTMVRLSERPPFTVDPRKLKPIEQTILKSAGMGAPLAALIKGSEADRGRALRACYGLYAAGLLEQSDHTSRKRPLKVQEETGVFVLSEIERKFGKIRATNARQEILMEFDRLDRASEQELLHVDGPLEEERLRQAFEKRRTEWENKRALVEAQSTLIAKVDVIQARLEKAYRQMVEEKRAAALENQVEEVEEEEPPTEVLEPPTAETLPPLNEDLFEEVGIDLTSASTPAPTETGGNDEVVEEELSQSPSSTSVSPSSQLYGAARVERVRQLLRDVKLHFQVRDWEHAVSLLYELVELEPKESKHHAMLARAMARHPVMRKDAERHFIDALRLAPQDADLHYSLGLYYKSFGMHARAQTEFRTCLRINPRHEGATKHISTGGRNTKDPLRHMFKKIFG